MSDTPPHDDTAPANGEDRDADGQQRDDLLWWGLSVLTWSFLISIALHALVSAPFLAGYFGPDPIKMQAEWIEEFEELEGIGHGADRGRWAEAKDLRPPAEDEDEQDDKEQKDEKEKEEKEEPDFEPELDVEDFADDEPEEPEEEPRFDDEEPDELDDEASAAAERPAPSEDAPDEPDEPSEEESSDKPDDEAADRDGPFRADRDLPAVDRAGPSDIPDLKHYGPGNARVTALIRLDRIRDTEYAPSVRRLIEALPDFRILAESTGFDPIEDMDAFFMASSNPLYIQNSFLAFRHQKSDRELKQILDNRFREPVPWETRGEAPVRQLVPESSGYKDPRKVMLARPGLTIVGKDSWLDEISRNLPADSALREHEGGRDEPGAATMIDGLAQIERAAAEEDAIAVMSAQGLVYTIPGLGRMQFEGVRLAVTNPKAPRLDVDLRFKSAKEARKFERECPAMKRKLKQGAGLERGLGSLASNAMGLGKVIDKARCRTEGDYVNISARYTEREVRSLAGLGASFAPNPPALNELPPPPAPEEDEGDEGTDGEGAEPGDESENAAPGSKPEGGESHETEPPSDER